MALLDASSKTVLRVFAVVYGGASEDRPSEVPPQRFYPRYRQSLHLISHFCQAARMIGPPFTFAAWITERVTGGSVRQIKSRVRPFQNMINRLRALELNKRENGTWLEPTELEWSRIRDPGTFQFDLDGNPETLVATNDFRAMVRRAGVEVSGDWDGGYEVFDCVRLDTGVIVGSKRRGERWQDADKTRMNYNVKLSDGNYYQIQRFAHIGQDSYMVVKKHIGIRHSHRAVIITTGPGVREDLFPVARLERPVIVMPLKVQDQTKLYIVEHLHHYKHIRGKIHAFEIMSEY